jgi:hypothetical protein
LPGIVELAKRGFHSGAFIKKCQYCWPKWILGEIIKSHFAEKQQVGEVDCWNSTLNEQAVAVFCFKDPDYAMSIMSTYGTVNKEGELTKMYKQAVTVFCFKDPGYTMSIMSTYGTVNEEGELEKLIFPDADKNEQVHTFKFT